MNMIHYFQEKNETVDSFSSRFRQKFGRGWRYAFNRFSDSWKTKNTGKQLPEYMELKNMDEEIDSPSTDRLRVSTLLTKYQDLDENLIKITVDRNGNQLISFWSYRIKGWTKPERLYNEDKTVRKSVDDKIKSGKI